MPRKSIARVAMDSGAGPLTLIDWLENGVPPEALEAWAEMTHGKKRVSRAARKKAPAVRSATKKKQPIAAKPAKKQKRVKKKAAKKRPPTKKQTQRKRKRRPDVQPGPRPPPAPPPKRTGQIPVPRAPRKKRAPTRRKKRRSRRPERKPRPARRTRAEQARAWWQDGIPERDALAVARELGIDDPRARVREWLRDGIPWEVLDNWARRKPWSRDAKLLGETAARFVEAREKGWREVTGKDWKAVKKAVKDRWGEREARIAFDWAVDEYDLEEYIFDYDAFWET